MKKKFFQLQEGVLTFVFEGTEEELKAHFEQERQAAIVFYEQAIEQCNKRIEKQVRPAEYEGMQTAEKVAIDAQIASVIAGEELKKSNYADKIASAKKLNIQDTEYFVFESIKIQ